MVLSNATTVLRLPTVGQAKANYIDELPHSSIQQASLSSKGQPLLTLMQLEIHFLVKYKALALVTKRYNLL